MKKIVDTIHSLAYYPFIIQKLNRSRSNLFFIFPSWQIGGAERVHLDILNLVKEKLPTCTITEVQKKDGLKKEFSKTSTLIDLKRWGEKKSFKSIILKKIASVINRKNNAVVFGSNNLFFYDLIPHLNADVKIIDLTHSFSTDTDGYEFYSLSSVPRINKRIVLGMNALETFQSIYTNKGISLSLMQRFDVIPNQVDAPETLVTKPKQGPLEILFVSRNSKEKRPDLFFQIVDACFESNLNVHFTIVGDFKKDFPCYWNKVDFKGELSDKEQLYTQYKQAHVILITSTFEGFPMVLLESMAYGVVPISTSVGEIPHFISEEQQTGFLIDHTLSDQEKIQQFMSILSRLALQKGEIESFSKNVHQLVRQSFSQEEFKNAYLKVLNML